MLTSNKDVQATLDSEVTKEKVTDVTKEQTRLSMRVVDFRRIGWD